MKPSTGRIAGSILAGLLVLSSGGPAAVGQGDGTRSIMAVMRRQYTVSRSPYKAISKELESDPPDWDQARDAAATFAGLAADLAKNEPPVGTEESWRQFLAAHAADAKALSDASVARDKAALGAAHRRIGASCKACHEAHRFRGNQGIPRP